MDLKELIKNKNATLVDVREPFELFFSKISSAKNIPLRSVTAKLEDFKKMPSPIILFCRSGQRSGKAMETLQANGIEEVYNGGGIDQVKEMLFD